MSSKSQKRNPDMSLHKAVDNALIIFLWSWCTLTEPTEDELTALKHEIYSVRDSINCGALTLPQLRKALKDEYGFEVGR